MPRVKRGVIALKKKRKIMKMAKGFRSVNHKRVKAAKEALIHSMAYAYRDRRTKKRDFRSLWIVRINAAAHQCGITYSRLMSGLKKAGVTVNRKVLADLAATDMSSFRSFVDLARNSLAGAGA
jgi:large subunit ribosomal protein L20